MRLFTALVLGLGSSSAWAFVIPPMVVHSKARLWSLKAVPLELEGVLDPSRSWDVKLTFQGETKVLKISEGTSVLEAAEKEWDAPFSCRNGICTTCAARVTAGRDNCKEAIHGLSPEQSAEGFVLTCQSYPCGPGLEIELGMYDTVYEQQYGRYEKKAQKEEKGKTIFG